MFDKNVYKARRAALVKSMQEQGAKGIAIFLGYKEAAMNYGNNCYHFHQDSTFTYFWGLNEPDLAASINLENGRECLYGDDVDINDIIWMGAQPSMSDKAELVGVDHTAKRSDFELAVQYAIDNDVPVHFLPSGRYYSRMVMSELTGTPSADVYKTAPYDEGDYIHSSEELTRAVIELRLVKEDCEIEQIDLACDLGVQMHDISRRMCRPGAKESDIAAAMEGFAVAKGWGVSFPTILSQNGQILHGHDHSQIITPGRLLLVDAGLALDNYYCSDFTRTMPCSGRFTTQQKEIYDIVQTATDLAQQMAAPGVEYRDVHIAIFRHILCGLKEIGIVNGDPDEMNAEGIAGMFMPHGLGHSIGLDVHDMEDLGENLVGYKNQTRSSQIGLGSLRMARKLVPGNVISDEPGIYFIPALWDFFKKNKLDKGFVNFDKLEAYKDFGGIRLEDDVLITETGSRFMGHSRLPIKAEDVEKDMQA